MTRQCFFNADEDKDLAKAMLEAKKELDELDELLNPDSILFRSQRWKVFFSENFLISFKKLTSCQMKMSVINLLLELSSGWRPKKRNVDLVCGRSSHIIKQFKVEGLCMICTIDIVKEVQYIQVLKVWDILALEDVPKLVTRLDDIFVEYTDDYINRCKEKCIEGNLEVPKTWAATSNVVWIKNLVDNESESELSGVASNSTSYIENSKLFYEHNNDMATKCFEKAKDTFREGRSKATDHRAAADRVCSSNPAEADITITDAAKIFESIGKADLAAKCFFDLKEYEKGEAGNFAEAADIAKLRGDILLAANLIQKAGNFKEACVLTLKYVLAHSLWSPGSKGWPLKQFRQKKELLKKAKSLAKNDSNQFYELVCAEADILTNNQIDLVIMNQQLNDSKRRQSISGEMLSTRKILDFHFHTNPSKYGWEDELVLDPIAYSEETICKRRVSVWTLVYFWDCWKDKIMNILEYLRCLKTQQVNDYRSCEDFCLNYLGVWKQYRNLNAIYLLLISDADWLGKLNKRYAPRNGQLVAINVCQLVPAAESYWNSDLVSVGMKVLDKLEALCKRSSTDSLSVFCHFMCRTHIHEIAKFLLSFKSLYHRHHDARLQKFVGPSTVQFFDFIIPIDWRESLRKSMISLRGTEVYRNIATEVISNCIGLKGEPSYRQIGSVVVMILGSGKLSGDVYERVAKRFDGNTPWKEFVESLPQNMGLESFEGSASSHNNSELEVSHIQKFHGALANTYAANWRNDEYITPACFLYLLERLLILLSRFQGCMFTTMSSFVDWLMYQVGSTNPSTSLVTNVQQSFRGLIQFVVDVVLQFLNNEKETMEWISNARAKINNYHSLVVLRLIIIICLLHLNFGNYANLLLDLLRRSYISNKLPRDFCDVLQRRGKRNILNDVAVALKKIGNPLVIVSLRENHPNFVCPDAIFVDMKVNKCKEEILDSLFPKVEASEGHSGAAKLEATNLQREVLSHDSCEKGKSSNLSSPCSASPQGQDLNSMNSKVSDVNRLTNLEQFWEIFDVLEFEDVGKGLTSISIKSLSIKEVAEKSIQLLTAAMAGCSQKNYFDAKDESQFGEAASVLEDLKQLYAALDGISDPKLENISTVGEIYKRLHLRKLKMEPFLKQLFLQQECTSDKGNLLETSTASASKCNVENTESKADKGNDLDKGKKKEVAATNYSEDRGNSQKNKKKKVKRGRRNK